MKKLFGTDGIRGIWNEDISPKLAYDIGKAVAKVFERENEKNLIVVGKDTRLSCDTLLSCLCSGITACGFDVIILDIVPTACVPFSIKFHNANAGIMITASHNPAKHNGFKFFNGNGFKISPEQESHIEYLIKNSCDISLCDYDKIGKIFHSRKSVREYINFLKKELKQTKNLKICFDTAHGCASEIIKEVFKHHNIVVYNGDFDGLNTNLACGANHIETLKSYVENGDFDIGFSFDGDADRLGVMLRGGKVLSGEEVIYFLAKEYKNEAVVVSLMTNMALCSKLESEGINCVVCGVGEKEIMDALLENNLLLGCENNGHYTLLDKTTTSDGILSAIKLLNIFIENGNLNVDYTPNYQVNKNVKVGNKEEILKSNILQQKLNICESMLLESGRIVLRPSGTENLIRILVEGTDKRIVDEIVFELEKTILEIAYWLTLFCVLKLAHGKSWIYG